MIQVKQFLKKHTWLSMLLLPILVGGSIGGFGSAIAGIGALLITVPLAGTVAYFYSKWLWNND